MLYAPLFIGLVAAWPPPAPQAILLLMAVTGLYLARHASGLALRQRARRDQRFLFWLIAFLALAGGGGLPLLLFYDRFALLPLAGVAVFIFLLHGAVGKLPARDRLWRAQWGELVGMTALTLTAPAAYVAAGGALDGMAWCLWAACSLFFGSGVLHVRMLLFASKEKQPLAAADRARLGWANLLYHALLLASLCAAASHLSFHPALLMWLGFLPILVRAVDGVLTLSNVAPSFKKVGLVETGYALWFTLCFSVALHSW
jgi:hypothetical protein